MVSELRFRIVGLMLGCITATAASAFDFKLAGADVRVNNLFTIGALMRMQDRDSDLIGISNATPGLCVRRVSADGDTNLRFRGDTCTTDDGGVGNQRAIDAPGTFSVNGDDGNLNFDRHDIVHATAKLTTDLSLNWEDTRIFVRGLYFFDERYEGLTQRHPDTTLRAPTSPFPRSGRSTIGSDLRLLDYFISHNFEIGDRYATFKLGNQVLNWGESAFLALNSLSAFNPPNAALLRLPGFDIKELFEPVGMAVLNSEIGNGINLEVFYQYDWRPVTIDPVGSFFSTTDFVGDGGSFAMLSLGKAPEDPEGRYRPVDNPDDPAAALGSTSSRTVQRLPDHEPEDGGQYGAALRVFADDLNGGTELGFYFANYHSRVPSASINAADGTCVPSNTGNPITNGLALIAACGIPPTNLLAVLTGGPFLPASREALPLDTATLFVEYPEDIRMWGLSFNTTIGDYALSGEYAYRENLPLQIHPIDLVLAALQPALPESDYSVAVATIPGRRSATPDFVQTNYRGVAPTPGMYIPGFERMGVGQLGITLLRVFGSSNPIGASQIFALMEVGMTHVLDFPELSELQFMGGAADAHISSGGDGRTGINPRDVRSDPNDPSTNVSDPQMRQNPSPQDPSSFGTEYSWGYRAVLMSRYDNLLFGANIEFLTALFHDVEGVSPGLGMNFIEGRKQILTGVRWDYQSTWLGELRYTLYTGGGKRDPLRDRDNLLLWLGYQF
jgi:hypothetical protein